MVKTFKATNWPKGVVVGPYRPLDKVIASNSVEMTVIGKTNPGTRTTTSRKDNLNREGFKKKT